MPGLRLDPTEPLWLNRARFSDRVAARLRHGRGLLAGDAAHAWAPVGGHGMNVGILGAHNLAWKLAAVHRGQAGEGLLDTYCHEQRRMAVRYVREMRFNFMELPLPRWATGRSRPRCPAPSPGAASSAGSTCA
ncbi:FAD-dependent monooxygenase [Streptomyces diastatochromogenes]|nr:FAD-dependent monooxygenase [Streptomyces diastatochromogenes]